jgi:hypothetical protein
MHRITGMQTQTEPQNPRPCRRSCNSCGTARVRGPLPHHSCATRRQTAPAALCLSHHKPKTQQATRCVSHSRRVQSQPMNTRSQVATSSTLLQRLICPSRVAAVDCNRSWSTHIDEIPAATFHPWDHSRSDSRSFPAPGHTFGHTGQHSNRVNPTSSPQHTKPQSRPQSLVSQFSRVPLSVMQQEGGGWSWREEDRRPARELRSACTHNTHTRAMLG